MLTITPTATKRCSRCRRWKPTSQFARHHHTTDGLQVWCRECKTTDMRLRRAQTRNN